MAPLRTQKAPGFLFDRRDMLGAGLGLACVAALEAPALAQAGRAPSSGPEVPNRSARTVPLFRSPEGFPNGLAGAEEGLWIAEQKRADGPDTGEKAMLVDWRSGRLIRSVVTRARNTSGIAWDGQTIWMGCNGGPQGFFQTALDGSVVSHRQIPLGPADNGGGCHGALWQGGKLWIVSNRLRGIIRVDPESWQPEYMIPISTARWHDIAWDDGSIWMVTGTSNRIAENHPGLARFDAATGRLLETASFVPGSADPHGLEIRDGVLYTCDAGIGPGFVATDSPTARSICRIEFV
jgi:hypothetical protein